MRLGKYFALLILISLAACNGKSTKNVDDSLKKDSLKKRKQIDSAMAAGMRPDDEELDPTLAEERKRLEGTYDKVEVIDTTLVVNNQKCRLIVHYRCLTDSNITEPARYDDETPKKEWVTHPFASDIVLITNADTVLNKRFTATDFFPFFEDPFVGNLKKLGTILMPDLARDNKNKINLGYSISIPATDLGIGMTLVIDPDGKYKIVK